MTAPGDHIASSIDELEMLALTTGLRDFDATAAGDLVTLPERDARTTKHSTQRALTVARRTA